ncbi:P-loop containing nucleoside triphosphate hydrolase protein [Podospora fimiseda]|uniref:P-loop containing nucleoside triphosphate hydrolase protein n=1 Tax=Podospora fimiseda TaxID=252190 RepID=A0AAN7BSF1_9PEZI|nr:P-loop containing nucleoside triphosphate hydrolase protein [Podospora fimiseda]
MEAASMTTLSMHGSFMGPNNALKDFGHAVKDINDALGELQARGIQHVVNLPELVLVGDQSSGKSSLMSALAGVSLPRSTGTCTRCPIHIRISKADDWSCRVFLNLQYEYRLPNHQITEADVTASNKFPPWVKCEPSRAKRVEFKVIHHRFDSEEIETVLRCAQLAILNPSTLYQAFIPRPQAGEGSDGSRLVLPALAARKEESSSEAQFSPNTVALEIKGPDLADLNFYDLPGVFNTARRVEDSYLERVVQNLTSEYIARPNAIILWAVPMNLDTENSLALRLIRQGRADHRSVGVITKADLLPHNPEAVERWMQTLHGKPNPLTGLGFFITSRQGSDLEEQIKREEAFFNRMADSTGHWPMAFDEFKERCGVEKLKNYLSWKLGEEFAKVLPHVKQKVHGRLQEVTGQLKHYPDPPLNPEMEIMRSLRDFSDGVKARISQRHFSSAWDVRCAEVFRQAVLSLKPKYNVKDHAKGLPSSKPVVIDLEGTSQGPSQSPTPRKRPAPAETPSRRQRIKAEGSNGAVFPSTPTHLRSSNPPGNGSPFKTPSRGQNRSRTLMDIRMMIQRNAIPGQPGLVSPGVYEPLFTEAVQTWDAPLKDFIRETFRFLLEEVRAILNTAFRVVKNRAIYKESKQYMENFFEEHREQLQEQLNLIYTLEAHSLFTKDAASLERYKAEELKTLTRHRNHYRIAAHNGEDIRPPPRMEDMTDEDLAQETAKMAKELRNLGPEQFEQELNVAAYTRAHYLVAANRFTDYVCIHVMSGLLPRVNSAIGDYLLEKLGLAHSKTTPEIIEKLMKEEEKILQRRDDLLTEKRTLDGAMDIIINLENRDKQAGSQFDATQSGDASDTTARGHDSPLSDRTRRYTPTAYGDA